VLTQRKFFSMALLFCLCPSLMAQEATPHPVKANQTIEIRTIGIPPYGIALAPGAVDASGIYYDVANLLAAGAGYTANNIIYPYARIVSELKSGKTDLSIMFKYAELDGYVTYVAPLPSLKTVIVGLKGSVYHSVDDLQGKTLAYLRGAKFSDKIDSSPLIHKRLTEDFDQGARMLLYGRVDAIIGPLPPIVSAIKASGEQEGVLGEPLVVDERTPWVQISNKSTARLGESDLKEIFAKLVARGDLSAIQEKYGVFHE